MFRQANILFILKAFSVVFGSNPMLVMKNASIMLFVSVSGVLNIILITYVYGNGHRYSNSG